MFDAARPLHNNDMASADSKRTRVSRWQNNNSPTPDPTEIKTNNDNTNSNIFSPASFPSSSVLPSLVNVTLPSLVAPRTQPPPPGLLPSTNIQSLLGEVPGLLKNHAAHQLFAVPPSIPPLRVFEVNEQRQPLPNGLVGFFASQQQQNFLPNQILAQQQQNFEFINAFLGNHQKNPIDSLNNTILSQLKSQQREKEPFKTTETKDVPPPAEQQHPLPVPPLPPNNSSMETIMVPPPPPPPVKVCQNSQCLADSPMDIEEDQDEVEPGEKEENIKGCEKKGRNKKVQMADELMKRALRPYFRRRRITKDEYKEIMKKGVAKLKKRHSLKAEKVEKFVSKYVQSVAAKRKNQQFGY